MVKILHTATELAAAAAQHASGTLRHLLGTRNSVRLLVATGASQLEFLQLLTAEPDIDWSRVELFHLDEYVGIDQQHPASFARYIRERILQPTGISRYHLLDGARDPQDMVAEMSAALTAAPVDLAFAGIGENGHLAFNDPPADFDTDVPYLLVDLDERCRRQQVNEGWFPAFEDVPRQAISISVRQLLNSGEIISVVPGKQKAMAVHACLSGRITPLAPASILREHARTTIYLDRESAALLQSGAPAS